MSSLPVTRVGDADVPHCSAMTRAQGSPDVFANNRPVSRQGDLNTPHLLPGVPCPVHAADITTGSTKTFANKKGFGRVGDALTACTAVAEGSEDTFSG